MSINPVQENGTIDLLKKTNKSRYSDCYLRSGGIYSRSRAVSSSDFLDTDIVIKMPENDPTTGTSQLASNNNNTSMAEAKQNEPPKLSPLTDLDKISKLVCRLVPIFSGENKSTAANEIDILYDSCRQIAQAFSSPSERAILTSTVKGRLRGEAYDLVKNIKIEKLDDLLSLLRSTFAPPRSINDLITEIRYCVQSPLENVRDYSTRLEKLFIECKQAVMRKYPTYLTNEALIKEIEEEAINTFKVGVRSALIRQVLLSQQDKSLSDLVLLASKIEKTEERQAQTRHISLIDIAQQLPKNIPESANNTQYNRNSYRTESQNPNSKFKCGFCSKIGHTYGDCRQRKSTPYCNLCQCYGHRDNNCYNNKINHNQNYNYNQNRNQNHKRNYNQNQNNNFNKTQNNSNHQKNTGNRSSIKCDFCARYGHTVDKCEAKKEWDRKNKGKNSGNA